MPYYPPDTPPAEPAQMPQATTPGPAPVPYTGGDQSPEPPVYSPMPVSLDPPSVEVMNGVSGNAIQESGYAHDINAGLVTTYYPGVTSPIFVGGDPDPGGRDIASSTVQGAVDAREAFYMNQEADTHPQGSNLGGQMTFPPAPVDPGAGPGEAMPSGAYYDPPRSY